ncbi:DUF3482 domain-containing protein [Noviherbaspirillum aerium]|uniref:DUF3482 domain-containing protein n=1 Tax=Noviherbaspirillum aerium TaxID=2588497 RepID=UPI00124D837D|nr:DUF3482 domain-containing protein [Noviherbaspirillum aerium]
MNDASDRIQLALISHTNAGKTTLARTLVGLDIGEVRDAPHVTALSEAHTLLAAPDGQELRLWDTPGFGDSVRLLKRLSMADNPIGWFLREIIDRYRDRPFWLSQQAMRTARDEADIVLYLVNSSEDPRDTGYLAPEMKILQWLGKPVIVLLNQMGRPRPFAEEETEQKRWKDYLAEYPVVRKVLALDAFARCWVHERVFYEAVGELLPAERGPTYQLILQAWETSNEQRLRAAMKVLAEQLLAAARDSEAVDMAGNSSFGSLLKMIGMGKQRENLRVNKAMNALMKRLNDGTHAATIELLRLHRLDAGAATTINERVSKNVVVRAPVDTRQAGLLGALISGATTGVSADLMAGGMTFGAGALVGALVGALTFTGAAWTFNTTTDRNEPKVQFSDDFMRTLVIGALLRYLAVAHFGRGRGNFTEDEAPSFWTSEVEAAVAGSERSLTDAWRAARSQDTPAQAGDALAVALERMSLEVLDKLYPHQVAPRLMQARSMHA